MKVKEVIREKNLRIELVETEELIGFIIVYRNRRFYLPPVIGDDRIPLPKKYMCFFDRAIFPEIVFVPYGKKVR